MNFPFLTIHRARRVPISASMERAMSNWMASTRPSGSTGLLYLMGLVGELEGAL